MELWECLSCLKFSLLEVPLLQNEFGRTVLAQLGFEGYAYIICEFLSRFTVLTLLLLKLENRVEF